MLAERALQNDAAVVTLRAVLGIDGGDVEAKFQAAVDRVNEAGGVNGRTIDLVVDVPIPIDVFLDEACVRHTEDEQVFAVVGLLFGEATVCYTELHETIAVTFMALPEQHIERSIAPVLTARALARRSVGENLDTLVAADLSNPQVVLDDIIYDLAGNATFYANEIAGHEQGVIWGNRGLFESQRTWDFVRIINESAFDIVINHIKASHAALVEALSPIGGIKIGGMYGTLPTPGDPASLSVSMVGYIRDVVTQPVEHPRLVQRQLCQRVLEFGNPRPGSGVVGRPTDGRTCRGTADLVFHHLEVLVEVGAKGRRRRPRQPGER